MWLPSSVPQSVEKVSIREFYAGVEKKLLGDGAAESGIV